MPSVSNEPLCPDWVFSNNSNVHTCKDRGWFTDYTPFESSAGSIYSGGTLPVLGVGTVILPTKKTPCRSGRGNHTQLILRDVLHVPSALCNIIGLTEDFHTNFSVRLGGTQSPKSSGTIKNKQGRVFAYFDASKTLFLVKLSGPPVGPIVGPSALSGPNTFYALNVRWDASELARWKAYKQGKQSPTSHASERSSVPPRENTVNPQPSLGYTEREKAWLKVHYGNEWHFLRAYGLSIYDDEEREEGRTMVRGFMAKEGPLGEEFIQASLGDESESTEVEEGEDEEESEESDDDMEGHLVDYLFDEQSLRWMKKHYGTSMKFMYSYGLKFYDPDDCRIAQQLVEECMQG